MTPWGAGTWLQGEHLPAIVSGLAESWEMDLTLQSVGN